MNRRYSSPVEDTLPRLLIEAGDGFLVTEDNDSPLIVEGVHDYILLEGMAGGRLLAENANTLSYPTDDVPGILLLEGGGKLLEESD